MTEVFLSPFLSENEQFRAKDLIKNLFPSATFAPKLSPNTTFRIVSQKDIFYTTKMDCLSMTIVCLKQIIEKNINLNDLSADWRIYCNLFLYQKKVVFYKLEEDLLKRCSTMVKCMGGIIIDNIYAGDIDYVITKECDEINPTLGILPDWIETLFYETKYVKPIHFYVKDKVSKEKSDLSQRSQEGRKLRKGKNSVRKSSLKTPVNEMRSIRSDNAGFILRRRDNSQDIRSFLNNPLSQDSKNDANIFDSFDGNQKSENAVSDEKTNDDLSKVSSCPLMKALDIPKSPDKEHQNSMQTFSDKNKNEEEDDDVIIISKEDFFNDKKPSKETVQKLNPVNERIPLKEKSESDLNLLSNEINIISKNPISKNAKLNPAKAKQTKKAESFPADFSSDDDDIDRLINLHKQRITQNSEKKQVYDAIEKINSFNQSFGNANPENNASAVDYGFDSNLNSFSQHSQSIQSKNSVGYDQSEDLLITENFSGNDPFLSILSGVDS